MNTTPYAPRIPIREYLARRGIVPRYERNGYGMYLSPLREERTPSFKAVSYTHLDVYKRQMSGHKDGSRAFARYRDIDMDIKREAVSVLE